MSDSFLFSGKMNLELRSPLLRGEPRYPPDEADLTDVSLAEAGCPLRAGLLFSTSFPCWCWRRGNADQAYFKSSSDLRWNRYICLSKNLKRQFHTLLHSNPTFASHQHRECPLSSVSSPAFTFVTEDGLSNKCSVPSLWFSFARL